MTEKRTYDAGFKLMVTDMAKKTNNCAAARKYGVTEKMATDWREKEDALKTIGTDTLASDPLTQCPGDLLTHWHSPSDPEIY
ncbi:hypothetical protein M514_15953 [Trichuris suis]|uniref:Brinker DNA-binding domain-containing protein n=1 Tax=Trichuris suis TaxID=68888 RepID=A0A085NQU7_9BILA|nr:hypothetical protein M514_15953 [Trichuris suis]